jgi:hypothetical protein
MQVSVVSGGPYTEGNQSWAFLFNAQAGYTYTGGPLEAWPSSRNYSGYAVTIGTTEFAVKPFVVGSGSVSVSGGSTYCTVLNAANLPSANFSGTVFTSTDPNTTTILDIIMGGQTTSYIGISQLGGLPVTVS